MSFQPRVILSCLLSLAASTGILAEEFGFRVRAINPESTYSSAAAFDVDKDGRLDVVSGGFWYQAPDWKRHFIRDVQVIRGRYDGYSHLPLDVNGDGWTDFVSANYRSRSIYWIEHPGKSLGPWTRHLIDSPGHMETARLHDINGDGQLDVLPNCVRRADGSPFAEWWQLEPGNATRPPRWTRHPLPEEIAGHGIGFGDIDGDGRGDIVGPHGWLRAPENPNTGRWLMQRDFRLDRDASIPILVFDVDGDGDNDICWGRGHSFGIRWLEQQREAGQATRWQRHVIDSSWSQPHSLLLADIDNDGAEELVAGKRYMGHDGKDPGEYDPLVAYWYKFDPQRRSWDRHLIAPAGRAGFGLDPKAIDLDGDGDLDLVGGGRSGLYWFENLLVNKKQESPTRLTVPDYTLHTNPLVYRDASGKEFPVTSPGQMAIRRSHILAGMESAMGLLPSSSRRTPLDLRVLDETETDRYIRRRIQFTPEPGDQVPAFLLIPRNLPGPTAAMLCLHQTTGIGKGEPAGLGGKPNLHYAHELAERGYVCIVPEYPSFGDYPFDFKTRGKAYKSGSMKAIWNNIRAVDVLESLPEVDPDRIGAIGHSLGGHNALFTAAFEQRIRAVVTSCGFTAFHHYYGGKLAGWTSDRYMPRIRDLYNNDPDRVPFDFYEVLAAIAPRGVFINAPVGDGNFEVTGVKKVVQSARGVFELLEAPARLEAHYPDSGHDFPPAQREAAYKWLDQILARR